jgi:glycosyltransferase involved in cell wall biosynthesis
VGETRLTNEWYETMISGKTVTLIIPARNEVLSLPGVLNNVPAFIDNIVVVNNGSTDTTAEVAQQCGVRVVTEPEAGYGRACLAGLAALQESPPDLVAFVDADGSDDLACLNALLLPLAGGRADLSLSWRRPVDSAALSPQQRYGNRLVTRLIRLIWGHHYRDLGPMRALTWPALLAIGMVDRDFGWTVEMQIRALKRGLRVEEQPVPYHARKAGRSKISRTLSGTLRAGTKMLWVVMREALFRN